MPVACSGEATKAGHTAARTKPFIALYDACTRKFPDPSHQGFLSSYILVRTYVVTRSGAGDLGHSRNASCCELGHSAREVGLASCRAGGGWDVSRSDLYRKSLPSSSGRAVTETRLPGKI